MISQNEILLRLVLAAISGGLIGLEREVHNRPAGLRTHILVSVGSALLMLVSMYGFQGGDPARLAAQVISGIGFLGAGTILREGNNIRGLTTAASLWVSGGIGLAIGNGFYLGAVFTIAIVLFSLISLGFFENQIIQSKYIKVQIICKERVGLLADITTVIGKNNIKIKDIKIIPLDEEESIRILSVNLNLSTPQNFSKKNLTIELFQIDYVKKIIWKSKSGNEEYENSKSVTHN